MKRHLGFFILVVLFLSMFAFISEPVASSAVSTPWPTTGWQSSTPEEQGVDSEILTKLLQSNSDAHTILVIRHGKVILDASRYPFTSSQPHELSSMTKSFVSTLVGIAIDKGYIKSVKQSIWDFFPKDKTANMDSRKEAITIENLLTQTTGLGITVRDDLDLYKNTDVNLNWVQFMLDKPMQSEPGTNHLLLDFNAHLASAIIQIATKMSTADFAEKYLFAPLGITDATWIADPQGVSQGGRHLYMSPASMAKLGYLYLHNGEWDGQQIVSAEWLTRATSKLVQAGVWEWGGSGYFWFSGLVLDTQYMAYGSFDFMGETIWVVPDLDLVVVATNDRTYGVIASNSEAEFDSSLVVITAVVEATKSDQPLPVNQTTAQMLQATLDEWVHPQAAAVVNVPEIVKNASGKVFQLEPNELGWNSISIDFGKADEATLTFGLKDKELKLPVGLDRVYRVSTEGLSPEPLWRPVANVPLMLKAGVLGKKLMVLMGDCMGMEFWTMTMEFSKDGNNLMLSAKSSNDANTGLINPIHNLVGTS